MSRRRGAVFRKTRRPILVGRPAGPWKSSVGGFEAPNGVDTVSVRV